MNRFFADMLMQLVATVAASPTFATKHFQKWATVLLTDKAAAKKEENTLYSIYSRLSHGCNMDNTHFLYSSLKVELILDLITMASMIEMQNTDNIDLHFDIMKLAIAAKNKAEILGIRIELKESATEATVSRSKLRWQCALEA